MYRIVLNETSYYGAGCRSVIADEIRKRGFKKVLLVTDKDLIRFGVAAKIEEVLRGADIPYEIYSQIKANPTIRNVQQGVEAFRQVEIKLQRRAAPFTANRITDDKGQFRSVKRAIPR